jgi:hypothetical protein
MRIYVNSRDCPLISCIDSLFVGFGSLHLALFSFERWLVSCIGVVEY